MRETIVQQFKRPNGVRTETLALKPMVACVLGLA
jgi:hypothetical protein